MIEIPGIFWIGLAAGIVASAISEWIKSAIRKRYDTTSQHDQERTP